MLELTGRRGAAGSLTIAAARQVLEDTKATDGLLDGLELRLYTDGPTPNAAMVYSDFTAPNFDGYAAITALTWLAAAWEDGFASVASVDPAPVFICTGSTHENTIKGFLLTKTDTGVTTVYYAEEFETPKAMTMAGHQVIVPPVLNLSVAA